jgi:hypothetical protein
LPALVKLGEYHQLWKANASQEELKDFQAHDSDGNTIEP